MGYTCCHCGSKYPVHEYRMEGEILRDTSLKVIMKLEKPLCCECFYAAMYNHFYHLADIEKHVDKTHTISQ